MKIEDNFLDQEDFDKIQNIMMGTTFSWFYNDGIVDENEVDRFQFIHRFYKYDAPRSAYFEILNPMFKKINGISLLRIKANLLTKTPNIVEHAFHVDLDFMSKKKQKQWTTSIFYVNTNNGYTEFEDGTKVESVANRLVTFPSNIKHRGTSCTDEKIRILINFDYFK